MKIEQQYKDWIIQELIDWAETFNNKYPEYMEEIIDEETAAYDNIHKLIGRLKDNICSKKDYENIIFHLWQKSHSQVSTTN